LAETAAAKLPRLAGLPSVLRLQPPLSPPLADAESF